MQKRQSGVMLLEALIAILIFSMGILAIVGLQASAIKLSGDAKYRADASLLANELIAQMWVSDRSSATLQASYATPSGSAPAGSTPSSSAITPYSDWLGEVSKSLPGVDQNPPTVTVVAEESLPAQNESIILTSLVTITLRWISPGETNVHSYVVNAKVVDTQEK